MGSYGRSANGKDKSCCSKTSWIIFGVIAFLLLIVTSGGIVGLTVKLVEVLSEPEELVDTVLGCSECPRCYSCLGAYTGQNVLELCDVKDISTVVQCTSQIYFLYSGNRADTSTPCYKECTRCRKCIETASRYSTSLTETMWDTVYAGHINDQSAVDPEGNCEVNCQNVQDTTQCAWVCPAPRNITVNENAIGSPARKKRSYEPDQDLCCDTHRQTTAYVDTWTDPATNDVWYPVWLYKSWVSPPYSVQLYDDVQCNSPNLCNQDWLCRKQYETRTMLMTKTPPGPSGYTRIILTYPNNNVRFIELELPCYCRCST